MNHEAYLVEQMEADKPYRIMCKCGWKSQPKVSIEAANTAWDHHIDTGTSGHKKDTELAATMAIDRLTTDCRETIKELYGTQFQSCIGPIQWLLDQLMQTVMERSLGND